MPKIFFPVRAHLLSKAYCLESDPAMIGAGAEPRELFVLSISKTSRVCTAFGAIKLDFLNNGP